jgi:hypothetical protein
MPNESQVFLDARGIRRCTVFASSDGTYSFLEEALSDHPMEMCWLPITKGRSYPNCSTFEIALREAQGRIEWLANNT